MPERSFDKEPDALRAEHLKEGIPHIIASICDSQAWDELTERTVKEIEKRGENIEYFGNKENLRNQRMLTADNSTYVVSDCNGKDKFSKGYSICTGVVFVGRDKITDKEISFLSHQNPIFFLGKKIAGEDLTRYKHEFMVDLATKIKKLIERSEKETIDAVIFGGNDREDMAEYEESIKLIAKVCKDELSFDPVVITGPNINNALGQTNIYFDTQKRRLYIVRPAQVKDPVKDNEGDNATNKSYLPSDFHKEKEEWIK